MLKIGIIGAGGIARANHIPAFQKFPDRCHVVAIADIVPSKAEAYAKEFGIAQAFPSHTAMLNEAALDAVVVATPNLAHHRCAVDALNKGLHVLCEKPLAMNGIEAHEMVRAARQAKKVLQVGLQMRFGPEAAFLRDYIKAGHMGHIYFARAQALRRRGTPSWGVFIEKDKQGGGPLVDIGVHILDLTLSTMGYPKPVSVSAQTWDYIGKEPGHYNMFGPYDTSKFTVEDFAAGFIRLENGAAVSLECSFMGNLPGDPFQAQFFGARSGASLKPWQKELTIYTEQDGQLFDMTPASIPKTDFTLAAAQSFLDAAEGKAPCLVTGEHGCMLNAVFDAMYKSAASGKEESVELNL
jgi:predicted dehydrogenase